MNELSQQDQEFVKGIVLTGNQTQSAKDAYGIENDGYARVKGHKQLTKDNIATAVQEVKRTLADRISTDKLEEVLNEGLAAYRSVKIGEDGSQTIDPDFAVRHKYLDTALKIKGIYETEEQKNINVIMPILVKFLDKKDDATNNNGDTD